MWIDPFKAFSVKYSFLSEGIPLAYEKMLLSKELSSKCSSSSLLNLENFSKPAILMKIQLIIANIQLILRWKLEKRKKIR